MADAAEQERLARLRAASGGVLPTTLPAPDGTIDASDRRHLLGQISPGVAVDPATAWVAEAVATAIWTAEDSAAAEWTAFPVVPAAAAGAEQQRLALLRASMGGILPVTLPAPGGAIDSTDRKHLLGLVGPGGVSADPGTIWTAVERHDPP